LSKSIHCHSGVPQGSHLGPIFFILDINEGTQSVIFNTREDKLLSVETTLAEALFLCRNKCRNDTPVSTVCTHTHQIFNYSISTKMRSSREMTKKTFDTVQTKLLFTFWSSNQDRSVTSGKKYGQTYQYPHYVPVSFCLPCSHQHRSSQTLSKMEPTMPYVVLAMCLLFDQFICHQSHVRWNPYQLHLNTVLAQAPAQLFTFIHQRVSLMRNFSRQHSLDRTQTISENSGGCITSAMCRSAGNRALSSAVKIPAGSYVKIHPHPFDEQQSPQNRQSKSHP
jgi:hypothetical protein